MIQMNSFIKQKQTHRLQKTKLWLSKEKGVGSNVLGINIYTLLYINSQQGLGYSTGNSTQHPVITCMGKKPGKEWRYIYV